MGSQGQETGLKRDEQLKLARYWARRDRVMIEKIPSAIREVEIEWTTSKTRRVRAHGWLRTDKILWGLLPVFLSFPLWGPLCQEGFFREKNWSDSRFQESVMPTITNYPAVISWRLSSTTISPTKLNITIFVDILLFLSTQSLLFLFILLFFLFP